MVPHARAFTVSIAQQPLFLTDAVTPQVMLNLSNDHQLYFAAYDDYSDITGDGRLDITYVHDHDYFGYFDPWKCYSYDKGENIFVPKAVSQDKYCDSVAGEWSGNFLNWVTMARIDTVRKLIYGGKRSIDTGTRTVLERTHLPTDSHSWAKHYNGSDLGKLTPFSGLITGLLDPDSGITFCNTTRPDSAVLSQNTAAPPLLRVAEGNFALWDGHPSWQCKWREERSAGNRNDPKVTGIPAYPEPPRRVQGATDKGFGLGEGLRIGEFVVRVEACVDGLEGTERCKRYPDGNLKPVGILQRFGDEGLIEFGLMTGSYGRNKSGGVLRKNIGTLSDEINVNTDGTFLAQPATGGIVGALDRFRIFGYRHFDDGTYFGVTGSDDCRWGLSSFDDGRCSNWGNPQSELFLESLRYFGGHSPAKEFQADDASRIKGLLTAHWEDPLSKENHCAPLNIIQFNASSSSFDGDQLARSSDVGLTSVRSATNTVGAGEDIHGKAWFIGETGSERDGLCTPKTISALGDVAGICPEAPRLDGTFNIAGLAHHAWTEGVRDDLPGDQFVRTYGVSLAPAVPQVRIPVPGSERSVTLLPACRNLSLDEPGNCGLAGFKVIAQDDASGSLYVSWDDSEQGGDFDSDMWGMIHYRFDGSSVLEISTEVVAQSTPNDQLGFGYVLSGTGAGDGFRVHSGINGFRSQDPDGFADCGDGCSVDDGRTSAEYVLGASDTEAGTLDQPLLLAAKWGGFDKRQGDTTPVRDELWDTTGDGVPDNFFFAVDPGALEDSLDRALSNVLVTSTSASSVATNSTRLDADTAIFQARFNSDKWSGQLLAFAITLAGEVEPQPLWDAARRLDLLSPALRRIFTSRDLLPPDAENPERITTSGVNFVWDEISEAQREALRQGLTTEQLDAGLDEERLLYLRGDRSKERSLQDQSQPFRQRDSALGDIINSNPQFVGTENFGYGVLGREQEGERFDEDRFPNGIGIDYFQYLAANANRRPVVVVGANDGMLHGFDARVDEENLARGGRELFAYVPAGVYDNLHLLSDPDYTHRYYVDGTPRVADAWLGSTKGWRKVVAGTTGAKVATGEPPPAGAGPSVFMLDLSNLSDPDNNAMTANDVLWEFRHQRLGVAIGQPSIVAMPNGRFGVIVSSGYNNGGTGRVFVLDAETGTVLKMFDTGAETAGLASPLVIDTSGDTIADRIYVGDLEGRVWRFDMSGGDPKNWGSAFDSGAPNRDPLPLFVATGPDGEAQPISAQVEAGRNGDGEIVVFFGTGTFFLTGDNMVPADPDVQSFYAVIDRDARVTGRSGMTEQEVVAEVEDFGLNLRVVTDTEPTAGGDGWFLDLLWKQDRGGPGPRGERVTQRAILRNQRIIFTTVVPSEDACAFGGSSFLMELNAFTGARIERPVFDLDGDGHFDGSDMVTITIDGEDVRVAPSGVMPDGVGLLSQPTILSAGEREYKFMSGTTGAIESVTERSSDGWGRHSWRELR